MMNFVIGYFRSKFGDLDTARRQYKILENNMFYGYVRLAERVHGKENWQILVKQTLDQIDFSESNSIWTEVAISSTTLAPKYIRKISNYFVELSMKEGA
jgi:hypothetical protein